MVANNTPVIIGVGQYSEKVDKPGYEALSYMDLAGRSLSAAIADSGVGPDAELAAAIDVLAAIRSFEMSRPDRTPPFGTADNIPHAIARRVGANPKRAILSATGGQNNQQLVGEFSRDIAAGDADVAAIVGAEAISTVLALTARGEKPDWSEDIGGDFDNHGFGLEELMEPTLFAHGATGAIPLYAIAENARRAKLGKGLEEYRADIGRLFEPFTRVAATNPHAAAPIERSAEELATITDRNRIVAEPYARMTVARDQVNQAAAIIIASAGKARELGVPEDKWVHIHAVSASTELKLSERPDLSANPASISSVATALARADKRISDIDYLDFYSCFAIPVFNQIDYFGLSVDDPRGLTLTGGLPFFGGAGNNYSTHAIAEAVARVRNHRGSYALVGANGGWMSKYATGIYSTEAADWSAQDRFEKIPPANDGVKFSNQPFKSAVVESYTIIHTKKGKEAVFIGRNSDGQRVCGNANLNDPATAKAFERGEPFGERLTVMQTPNNRNIAHVTQD